jgi:simple sugar transport system permease protein
LEKHVLTSPPSQKNTAEEAQPRENFWKSLGSFFLKRREASIFIVAILLFLYFNFSNANFTSLNNINTLAEYTAATAIIAAGEVMLLICGEIDLSVGYTFAFAPFIMYFANQAGLPVILSIVVALIASAAVGALNGLITVLFKVPSFITTLGTYFFLNGLTLTISGGFPTSSPEAGSLNMIFGNNIYWESAWALLIIVVMQVLLSFTRWGLHTVSAGSNPLGASEVGINTNRIKLVNFMIVSVFAGFAGILESFRVTSIDPTAGGPDIMFAAVSGAVIGGTALQGGSGTIIGALLGTLVLSILKDGLTIIGVSAYTYDMILGIAIAAAMIINVRLQILRRAGRQ